MSQKILITKFSYSLPAAELKAKLTSVATPFSEIPGCQWKIWIMEEEKNEGGGIYLFRSEKALEDFLQSPLWAAVKDDPDLSNLEIRAVDVVKEPSEITRAPLMDRTLA